VFAVLDHAVETVEQVSAAVRPGTASLIIGSDKPPSGGESGIRTHGTLSRTHAFQACALSRSAISPWQAGRDPYPDPPRDATLFQAGSLIAAIASISIMKSGPASRLTTTVVLVGVATPM
jgi:hypothetical protein